MKLYKYRPWDEFTKRVITHGEIWLPTRRNLNDPAELVHPFVFELSMFSKALQRVQLTGKIDQKIASYRTYEKLVRFRGIVEEEGIGAVPEDLLMFQEYDQFADPIWAVCEAEFDSLPIDDAFANYLRSMTEDATGLYQDKEILVDRLNDKLDNVGIFSMTSDPSCPVMWAHYGDNHRGIVLIFDTEEDDFLSTAKPVTYVKSRPENSLDSTIENFFRKGNAWQYEQEYRALAKEGHRAHVIEQKTLSGILLGLNMPREDRSEARALASSCNHLTVDEAYADPNSYSILHRKFEPSSNQN